MSRRALGDGPMQARRTPATRVRLAHLPGEIETSVEFERMRRVVEDALEAGGLIRIDAAGGGLLAFNPRYLITIEQV